MRNCALLFQLYQITKDSVIAALDRKIIKHSIPLHSVNLQICLILDEDDVSKTPLDLTWMVVSCMSSVPVGSAQM